MKAIRLHARGGPEQLVYEDGLQPVLQPFVRRILR